MNLQGIDTDYAFARNPIIFRQNYQSFEKAGGKFVITLGGSDIFEGSFASPLNVDISEIVDAYVDFFPEPPENNTNPIIIIEDSDALSSRQCGIYLEYGDSIAESGVTVIPGGISRQNYKRLFSLGKEPFTTRFLNPQNNFFLTTRSAGWRIVMKETELYPLYFIADRGGIVTVEELTTGRRLSFVIEGPGVYALDVDSVRRRFWEEFGILVNVFDVLRDDKYSCQIVIERSQVTKDRYRIKFRNSLGVFEVIEVTGSPTMTADYSSAEDSTFIRYDSITGSFYSDRNRIERKQSITVDTGVKRPEEVRFLMDMIGSEEVYLLDLTPLPVKVIPSVEDFEYKPRPETPEHFTIKLTLSDSEINIMPEIVDGDDSRKPRVFSEQFSDQFN